MANRHVPGANIADFNSTPSVMQYSAEHTPYHLLPLIWMPIKITIPSHSGNSLSHSCTVEGVVEFKSVLMIQELKISVAFVDISSSRENQTETNRPGHPVNPKSKGAHRGPLPVPHDSASRFALDKLGWDRLQKESQGEPNYSRQKASKHLLSNDNKRVWRHIRRDRGLRRERRVTGGWGGRGEGPHFTASQQSFYFHPAVLKDLKYVSARYNAAETTARRCMKGTRVEVIQDIIEQLTRPPDPLLRLVMCSGPAGSGKSTIAKTIAADLEEKENLLAASFFFSRDYAERKEIEYLPSTLAHQLADYDPVFRSLLVALLESDRSRLIDANPKEQFQKMIVQLLAQVPSSQTPWVICLDALDECGKDHGKILLQWLSDAISDIPVHVRFFLTGRPEVYSYLKSNLDSLSVLCTYSNLEAIDTETTRKDIRLYVAQSLIDHTWDRSAGGWGVNDQDADEITSRAAGLFIFAATAVRYVLARSDLGFHPKKSVDILLKGDAPLNSLYDLYLQIIEEVIGIPVDNDTLERTKRVLSAIVDLVEPQDIRSLAGLLEIDVQELQRTLVRLSAVLCVPDDDAGVIKIIHLSFREFLTGREKQPEFVYGAEARQYSLVLDTFRVMQKELKFNICDLPTSHVRNTDIPDLWGRKQKYILGHLAYSCRFWAGHLASSHYSIELAQIAGTFVVDCFLFWLEVLSLIGAVGSAAESLSKFSKWSFEDPRIVETVDFVRDGRRFITFFRGPIVQSAPHIYLSALALAPQQSRIAKHFRPQFPLLLSAGIGQMEVWPATMLILEKHTGAVNSVAFSPDGKWIVSGSDDKTVRVWDSESGEVVAGPFNGHTNCVNSVAFSPNGKYIVSGSDDNTVCVWDAESGEVVAGPLHGHTSWVKSVAFSPDSKHIVSGSNDLTVCVWDAESGEVVAGPFNGHTDCVNSVAFSPDNKQIVSGSDDGHCACGMQRAASGDVVAGPFNGHTSMVSTVAFSPDGKQIVSGSYDNTVRVWDAKSGEVVAGPFSSHTHWVKSVAFSPDSKHIVSGSDDNTIAARWLLGIQCRILTDGKWIVSGSNDRTVCVWDAESGNVVAGPFDGHTSLVNSVAFSPDGKRIVSGLNDTDSRVCIWDAESGEVVAGSFNGHKYSVNSVAFSPNGKQIISGSDDNAAFSPNGKYVVSGSDDTRCACGMQRAAKWLLAIQWSHYWVNSVAFSPDQAIVSGSADETVRVWDAESGEVVAGPFHGHTNSVNSVAFSPDGKYIVSGSNDRTVCVWDAESGKMVAGPFNGHTYPVKSVAFSPDGKQIVSGSSDNTRGGGHWTVQDGFSEEP
ncbi:WD40-repeat-containing domain protein [Mycena haematopus]|nr:WD40-repeat-containing domain protein [Mycena haematopus]